MGVTFVPYNLRDCCLYIASVKTSFIGAEEVTRNE